MIRDKHKAPFVASTNPADDMIERLALAACGVQLWPNPYARQYHRAAVKRMVQAITRRDLRRLAEMVK